jgi:integrase
MRRRGDAWELRAYVGTDPVTGKQRYATRTVRGGKRHADAELAKLLVEVNEGRASRTTATVAELLDAWLEHAERGFSPKTVLETRGFVERTLKPGLGSVPLSKLRPADIDRFYARLQLPGGGRSGRAQAPGTVRRVHEILRRALEQGVRWGWLGVNPADRATPPRPPAPSVSPPPPGDVARLFALAAESDPAFAVFVMLAAASGARRSELIALRWTDLEVASRTLTIGRAVVLGP